MLRFVPTGAGSMPTGIWIYTDRGWKYVDMGWMYTDRVWMYVDMGWMYTDRCWMYVDMGWMYTDRGWKYANGCMIAADNFQI